MRDDLYVVRPAGQWKRLRLPPTKDCPIRPALFPSYAGQRTVGLVAGCLGDLSVEPADTKKIITLDISSGRERPVVPYGVGFGAGGFALDPKGGPGLLNDGNGLYERLRWLRRAGLSAPIRLGLDRVGDPARSRATLARVALPGVDDVGGVEGISRSLTPWHLFFLDTRSSRLKRVAGAFQEIYRGGWSSDDAFYAFPFLALDQSRGLAIVEPGNARIVAKLPGKFASVDWSGARTLVATVEENGSRPDRLVWIRWH